MLKERVHIPTLSEIRKYTNASIQLKKSKVPDLFNWMGEAFSGVKVLESHGQPGVSWPAVQLQGVWTEWQSLGITGSTLEVSTSTRITVGFNDQGSFIDVTGMNRVRKNGAVQSEGERTRRVKPVIMNTSSPLVDKVAETIKITGALNPGGEEIDIHAIKNKAIDLRSLQYLLPSKRSQTVI